MKLIASALALVVPIECSTPSESSADCSIQVRFDGTVYTGYAFTDHEANQLGVVDQADCHDAGEDPQGSVFGDDPAQVDVGPLGVTRPTT